MHDMQTKFEFAAERYQKSYRRKFRFLRARLEIRWIRGPIGCFQMFCGRINRTWELCVHQKRQGCLCNVGEGFAQLLFGNHRKFVDTRMDQKTFEASDSRACK